jgi:4-oxalocrotonate tautomerase
VPLVTIDLLEGRSDEQLDAIAAAVQQAMVETLTVPERDQFQIITEHDARTLRFNPVYLKGERGDGFVLVRVVLAAGRATEVKRTFYARLAALLNEGAGVRVEDVMIVLVENAREDWSFGDGIASYLEIPPSEWR